MRADGTIEPVEVISAEELSRRWIRKEAARGYADCNLVYDSRDYQPDYGKRLAEAFFQKEKIERWRDGLILIAGIIVLAELGAVLSTL